MSLEESMILELEALLLHFLCIKWNKMDSALKMVHVLVTGSTGGVGSMAVCILAEQRI